MKDDRSPIRQTGENDKTLLGAPFYPKTFINGEESTLPHAENEQKDTFPVSKEGQWIGPYHLLREIGEGGMGLVFEAEQLDPIRRRVALKVVKHGLATGEFIARFESERRALAVMDHPNIARVLDAGTSAEGQPMQATFHMSLLTSLTLLTSNTLTAKI